MRTCREVSRIAASDELEGASFMRRLGIRMHLLMCRHCRRYVAQIRRLGEWARRHVSADEPDPATRADLKARVMRNLPGSDSGG